MITLEVIYGALYVLLLYIGSKVADRITMHVFDRAIFESSWRYIKRELKILQTNVKQIHIDFQFKMRITPEYLDDAKTLIGRMCNHIAKDGKGCIDMSTPTWGDDGTYGKVDISFGKLRYTLNITLLINYERIDKGGSITSIPIDNISVSTGVDFPFSSLSDAVMNLNVINSFIRQAIIREVPNTKFSKGTFVVAPIKGKLTLDQWIKEKKFDVSLLLKSEEQIIVEFYVDRAELTTPYFEIDASSVQYLRGILLNYYLY
jgi:hypothetical protein